MAGQVELAASPASHAVVAQVGQFPVYAAVDGFEFGQGCLVSQAQMDRFNQMLLCCCVIRE